MMSNCSGCGSLKESAELTLQEDGNKAFCQACNYEYEAKMDNLTGGDDE
jgi:transcription elongation factor Elf1